MVGRDSGYDVAKSQATRLIEMTTFITDPQAQLAEIEVRRQQAWAAYNESLRGLSGKDYEEAKETLAKQLHKKVEDLTEDEEDKALAKIGLCPLDFMD